MKNNTKHGLYQTTGAKKKKKESRGEKLLMFHTPPPLPDYITFDMLSGLERNAHNKVMMFDNIAVYVPSWVVSENSRIYGDVIRYKTPHKYRLGINYYTGRGIPVYSVKI